VAADDGDPCEIITVWGGDSLVLEDRTDSILLERSGTENAVEITSANSIEGSTCAPLLTVALLEYCKFYPSTRYSIVTLDSRTPVQTRECHVRGAKGAGFEMNEIVKNNDMTVSREEWLKMSEDERIDRQMPQWKETLRFSRAPPTASISAVGFFGDGESLKYTPVSGGSSAYIFESNPAGVSVAFTDDMRRKPVAIVTMGIQDSFGPFAWISRVDVDPQHRSRGLCAALLTFAVRRFVSKYEQVKQISLKIESATPLQARKCYVKALVAAGFPIVSAFVGKSKKDRVEITDALMKNIDETAFNNVHMFFRREDAEAPKRRIKT
jgi:hypothetical protein